MAHPYAQQRPTLPPLHTLDLPTLTKRVSFDCDMPLDSYDHSTSRFAWSSASPVPPRTPSLSLSLSDCSSPVSSPPRTPSPSFSESQPSSCISIRAPTPPGYDGPLGCFRLQPSSLEEAHAVIVASLVDAAPLSPDSPLSAGGVPGKTRAVLLMGKALEHLRHPQRPLAKGARLHPYRIVARTPVQSRRSSTSF